jgi:hypothetical protein
LFHHAGKYITTLHTFAGLRTCRLGLDPS